MSPVSSCLLSSFRQSLYVTFSSCLLFFHVSDKFLSTVSSFLMNHSCPLSLTYPISSCPLSPHVPCHSRFPSHHVHYHQMSPVTHVSYLLRSTISSCPLFPHVSCLLFHHVSYSLRSLVYSCLPHVPFTAGLLFPRVSCHFMSPVLPCLTYISSFRVPYPLKSAVSSSLLSLQVLCLPMSPIP